MRVASDVDCCQDCFQCVRVSFDLCFYSREACIAKKGLIGKEASRETGRRDVCDGVRANEAGNGHLENLSR